MNSNLKSHITTLNKFFEQEKENEAIANIVFNEIEEYVCYSNFIFKNHKFDVLEKLEKNYKLKKFENWLEQIQSNRVFTFFEKEKLKNLEEELILFNTNLHSLLELHNSNFHNLINFFVINSEIVTNVEDDERKELYDEIISKVDFRGISFEIVGKDWGELLSSNFTFEELQSEINSQDSGEEFQERFDKLYKNVLDIFGEGYISYYYYKFIECVSEDDLMEFYNDISDYQQVIKSIISYINVIRALMDPINFIYSEAVHLSFNKQNPFPNIFIDYSSYKFFNKLFTEEIFSHYCVDVSFVYLKMLEKKKLDSNLKIKKFEEWVIKFLDAPWARMKNKKYFKKHDFRSKIFEREYFEFYHSK